MITDDTILSSRYHQVVYNQGRAKYALLFVCIFRCYRHIFHKLMFCAYHMKNDLFPKKSWNIERQFSLRQSKETNASSSLRINFLLGQGQLKNEQRMKVAQQRALAMKSVGGTRI